MFDFLGLSHRIQLSVLSHHFIDMDNVSNEMANAIQKRVNVNLVCEFVFV